MRKPLKDIRKDMKEITDRLPTKEQLEELRQIFEEIEAKEKDEK